MTNPAYKTAVEYETLSGVKVHITPLSVAASILVLQQVKEELPYPDQSNYLHTPEGAVGDWVQVMSPEKEAEYTEQCRQVDEARSLRSVDAFLELCAHYPDFASREALVQHFVPQLEQLRKFAALSGDDWRDTLDHCVYTGREDKAYVVAIAQQRIRLLREEDVLNGVRLFRPDLPGRAG